MEDFYDLLGVSADASTDEIDRAWRERVRRYHPDVNDDTRANAQFKTLKTAHEVLSDESERAAYDRMGHDAYVRERLGGLPTTEHPYTDAATNDDESDRDGSDGHSTDDERETSDGRAGNEGRTTSDDHAGNEDRTGDSDRAGNRRSRSKSRSNEDARSRTRTASTGAAGESQARASDTAGGRQSTTDGKGNTQARSTSTAATRPRGIRKPLVYGWIGVALAAVVYLVGLRAYLVANAGALSELRVGLAADPVTALTATRSLTPPGAFVLDAAAANATLPLIFGVGAAALAVAFAGVVLSFGRGAAYLYLLGGIAPLAGLGIGPFVAVPDGVVLALTVAFPLVATLAFLVEVGWVLLAGR